MKIGLILAAIPGYSETFFKNWVIGLRSHGLEPVLFVDRPTSISTYHDGIVVSRNKLLIISVLQAFLHPIRVFKYFRKLCNYMNVFGALKRVLLDVHILSYENLDWIHFGFGTIGINREFLPEIIGSKSAVSFRGFDIAIYPLKNPNCYDLLLQRVNKIHVISDDIHNLILSSYGGIDNKIEKITPAIDPALFPISKSRDWNDLKFISVGRLHWKKGLNYVIEALTELHNDGVDFEYTIIGSGPEYERIAFMAYKNGILDKINFLNQLEQREIVKFLSESNYFIQYSVQEGFGNAVLEAQSSGLISIVSDAEGLSENVLDGITGFVVPKLNTLALFNQIIEIVEMDNFQLDAISSYASERVKNEYYLEKQVNEFMEFYAS